MERKVTIVLLFMALVIFIGFLFVFFGCFFLFDCSGSYFKKSFDGGDNFKEVIEPVEGFQQKEIGEETIDIKIDDEDVEIYEVPVDKSKFSFQVDLEKEEYLVGEYFNFSISTDYNKGTFPAVVFMEISKRDYESDGEKKFLYLDQITTVSDSSFDWSSVETERLITEDRGALSVIDTERHTSFGGPSYYFSSEGIYDYKVKIFGCDEIAKEGFSCYLKQGYRSILNYNNKSFFSKDEPTMILAEDLEPLDSVDFSIFVGKNTNPDSPSIECSLKCA